MRFALTIDDMMFGLSIRGVGLDIREERVCAVLLKRKGQRVILAGVGVSGIPRAADEPAAAQAVLEALKSAGAKKRDPLVCSIGGPEVVIKAVRLPTLPLSRVLDAVRWHFQENSFLPAVDAVFDAQVLHGNNGRMNILAVCAPTALVEERLRVLELAHINPRHVDVEPLATLNAFLSLEGIAEDETIVLLSLSERAPFLCIFNRESGDALIRYFPEGLENPAAAVEDIRASVAYYQAEMASGSSLRCVYCGSEELFASLREEMENLLALWNIPDLSVFDPLSILQWEGSVLPPGKSIQGAELANAVGLALRAL